jgi:hypothetical protein
MSGKRQFSKKYKKKATEYHLVFESDDPDDPLNDLEVYIRSLPIDQFVELSELAELAPSDRARAGIKVLDIFTRSLVDWNLTDEDDQEISADKAGVYSQELDFILRIIQAWMTRMGGVEDPLELGSSSGRTSPVESLPMEVS